MHVTKRLKAVIPTTNEGMSNVSLGTCQKLFEALFPGSSFSAEKAPLLVSALKSFADSVAEHFDHQSQEVNSGMLNMHRPAHTKFGLKQCVDIMCSASASKEE
jgi:hypothetical protein